MAHIARSLLPHLKKQYGLQVETFNHQMRSMINCLSCPEKPWDLGLYLTTNQHIQKLNKRYRQQNKPTDILSFPAHKISKPGRFPRVYAAEKRYLGDIFISLPYVKSYCNEERVELPQHMPVLLAHGICHLLGYDHENDEDYELMAKAEAHLLKRYEKLMSSSFV